MTDDLEARLRAAVRAEAAAAHHDAGSLTAIRTRVRSARRRRHTLALLGAVALVVALGAVPRLGQDDDQRVSTQDQPNADTTTSAPATTTTPSTETTTTAPPTTTTPTTATPDAGADGGAGEGEDAVTPPAAEATTATPRDEGDAGPGCVDGWTTPAPGTARRVDPLDAIRRQMGVTGQFRVLDMRYFTGPEVPWISSPALPTIEWWYVKAELVDDPTFRARWLVVRRSPGVDTEVIAAAAPFGTTGYRSPDWRAFLGEGEPRAVDGLPGQWAGVEYDFVTGEDGDKPGLPAENAHCLDGT
jgi:hypothetical protein